MCKAKKRSGRMEVSEEIKKKFDEGGKARRELVQVMIDCNKDKEASL